MTVPEWSPARPRRYRSPLRQEHAQRTRAAVLDAATRLFISPGYGVTTMKDIAAEAGVSVESVYAQGTKPALLLASVDRALVGDDAEIPLIDRADMQAVLTAPGPRELLRRLRDLAAVRLPATAPIFEAFRRAAAVHPDLARAWHEYDQRRYSDCARIVQALSGALRPGLTPEAATETFWALSGASVMLMFCEDRGWSPEAYADWLTDSLERLLLA